MFIDLMIKKCKELICLQPTYSQSNLSLKRKSILKILLWNVLTNSKMYMLVEMSWLRVAKTVVKRTEALVY